MHVRLELVAYRKFHLTERSLQVSEQMEIGRCWVRYGGKCVRNRYGRFSPERSYGASTGRPRQRTIRGQCTTP